jgi:biopolymer transport protein ExbB
MKTKLITIFGAFFAVIALSTPVVASEAKSLVELLDMIESAKISETAEYRQREADFLKDQRKQSQLLKGAKNTKAAEERRSDRLEQIIRDNDIKLAALREQRD